MCVIRIYMVGVLGRRGRGAMTDPALLNRKPLACLANHSSGR